MSGFTPGPWSYTTGFVARVNEAATGRSICGVHKSGKLVGEASDFQVAANARLIAAAPDLFEALGELVYIIDAAGLSNLSRGVQLGPTSWFIKASDRLEAAHAAIAKASPSPVLAKAVGGVS